MYRLPGKRTAVQEEWCVIVLFVWLPISLGVWDPKVFLAGVNELFSQLFLHDWILSVHIGILGHIVAVLDLVLLCFEEPIEMILQSTFFGTSEYKHLWLGLALSSGLLLLSLLLSDSFLLGFKWNLVFFCLFNHDFQVFVLDFSRYE